MKKPNNHDDHHLPEEILIEIFEKLPAKSVAKFRCLSKSWRTRLSTHQFIKKQLLATINAQQQHNLILISSTTNGPESFHTITPSLTDNVDATKLQLQNTLELIMASCNGLILLTMEDTSDLSLDKFLINPTTGLQVKLPRYPFETEGLTPLPGINFLERDGLRLYGFGYDSFTDDYKIVQLSYFVDPTGASFVLVHVYSVKTDVWKRIESSTKDHSVHFNSSGAFVNGAIHWLSIRRGSACPFVVVAFDLTREVFSEIAVPANFCDVPYLLGHNRICVIGGCLCIVDSSNRCSINVWMMKEYGRVGSWTKFRVDTGGEWDIETPLCFMGDKEVVFLTDEQNTFIYDMQKNTFTGMAVNGVSFGFSDREQFIEVCLTMICKRIRLVV